MARRIRPPEAMRVPLTDGDWLLLKKRLTAGEERAMFARMSRSTDDGLLLDRLEVGRSKAMAYLVDWGTFTDTSGKPIVIRDKSVEEIGQILDALDPRDFADVRQAVDAHVEAMEAERAAEKNETGGETPSSAVSPSHVSWAGDMSGSRT